MNVALSTERLLIREVTLDDAAFILKLLNDKGWLQFIGDRSVHNLEDAKAYIENAFILSYKTNGYGLYMIQCQSTYQCLGLSGLVNRPSLDDIDIGFAFLSEHCGKGYGYESSKAILDYAFNDLQIKKIVGITLEPNLASRKLLEKLGLTFERIISFDGKEELMLYGIIG